MKKTLFLRIFAGYAAVIVLLAGAVMLVAPPLMRTHHIEERALSLERMALLLESRIVPSLSGGGGGDLEALVAAAGRSTGTRITVIDAEGTVLADSETDARDMENHLYRPEILASLQGEKQMSIRSSSTLKTEMMYMSIPVRVEDRIVGALRLSYFMRDFEALMARLRGDLLTTVATVTLVGLLLAFFLARSVSRPLREVIDTSKRVAAGDFGVKVSTRRSGEFRVFARSFNAMTGKLDGMFGEIRVQNEEIRSILGSIREGLAVLDGDARIVICNDSFRRIAGQARPEGRHFWEVVRSSAAAEIVRKALEGPTEATGEATVGERVFMCSVSRLAAADRLVVTLHDVTEFRALEKAKRDFVVNVSHELRTPLTTIKGFVETMESGAMESDRPHLEIIRRNTDRLIAIVEDLLVLSRLEAPGARPSRESVDVRAIAESVLELFGKRAAEKGIRLGLEAPDGLAPLAADPAQLEGLLVNLVDNAVKYTDQGAVTVRLGGGEGRFRLEVEDTGVGIDPDHLPHVFERFYVADKSRSKKLGGTGLGLAIVKHVAQAHGGAVSIRSRLGEGTAVLVEIPLG
ncbi:MAG: HAMP domain-containing protein [Candidatus Aminicenantes bacterium]|nr:HAMP domain-containing protein [Candidatus Aminicenantes bacterium]